MNTIPAKLLLPFALSLTLLSGCAKEEPQIHAACELASDGTYLIKWETFPPLEGTVKIYESDTPDSFNLHSPIAEQAIGEGYKKVLAMQTFARTYFKLVFDRKYTVITTDRIVPMQGLFNFRDLGGYYNTNGKQTRWGKLYRSSSLSMASLQDVQSLIHLGIETLIDFRPERETYLYTNKYKAPQIYNMPLRGNPHNLFFKEVLSQKMKRNDILAYDQSVFSFLLENNSDYFAKMFDILMDEKNYPVVIYCSLGKDRSAIASALILAALDLEVDDIVDDYLLSNERINLPALIQNADLYPIEVQETLTALFSAHQETIRNSFEIIKSNYGSVEHYLEKELKLTARKKEKLKEILLY